MRGIALVFGLIMAAAVGTAADAAENQSEFAQEVRAYQEATVRVCETGVTPEMRRLYVAAQHALDHARYGGGTGSNFFGLKSPEDLYQACFQSIM